LGNDLYNPRLTGFCHLHNATYINYYTGTELKEINGSIDAKGDVVYLSNFSAPTLSAKGELQLKTADLFPFKLDVEINDFKFVDIDLVNAWAKGEIHISGNTSQALAKGDIEVTRSDLAIPDHIPHTLPELKVTYINATQPVATTQTPFKPYPLFLDLNVTAPEGIIISGRGLDSEWKGNFHIGGQQTDIVTQGKLELLSGEFNFSSRSFKLTEGALNFSGKGHQLPTINLAGEMHASDVTIIARLKGPINSPQVTLQSNPSLPMGTIMSYLLFGQNLAEISGLQALQLANSLASLAGQGPDMLESTRRALGLDRLRVIAEPVEEGGESISIQVGKYVAEGVLVSFTQGTEDSSTNINIQVDIGKNFIFQAESDQRIEQGKFTLKYSHNY
jgi:translocation and assembly module TamB